jgi:hypothetical protein
VESSTSTSKAEARQAEAVAASQRHSEEVRRAYRARKRTEAPSTEEREASETASSFYSILAAGVPKGESDQPAIDAEGFCDLMSEAAKVQTIRYARASSGVRRKWDCESAVDLLVLRSARAGGLEGVRRVKVVGVNAEGGQATASVRFGDGPVTSIRLVRVDGAWKLAPNSIPSAP